jgi:hypothetical protein
VRTGDHTAPPSAILGRDALGELTRTGTEEGSREAVEFAKKLRLHAATEEEVLYPAAILVGEHVKLTLAT